MQTKRSTKPHDRIEYDRETKDFSIVYQGRVVGFAPTPAQAQARLDAMIYDRLVHDARLIPATK